jgi:4-amino-4-deoxychorismate lyase
MMKIGWNGQVVDEQEAVISVFDHGFLYGMGCFETFRTYGGTPFLFHEHMDRLERSCREIGIRIKVDRPAMLDHLHELTKVNGFEEAYIRCSVSAGQGIVGLPSEDYIHPNTIIYMKALPALGAIEGPQDRALQVLNLPRNTPEGSVRIKSFHYMNNILAKREMSAYPWSAGAEGLFLTSDGLVAEGIVSNVFMVRQGKVYTPSLRTGILPGITRAFIMQLLDRAEESTPVIERDYGIETWTTADEIFLTNSIQEIVAVDRVYDQAGKMLWRREGDATMTNQLFAKYRAATQTQGG